ncbi:putative F-box/FBD/LRR-repeat protein [Carex littledalei]|uniref:Putative F-box/FBD/LRR-repeat protein n=1 Tax=Carex littledalei TaxID=544730 RepID=A0A833RAW4_9POAL|nr:putative F-box/FBD/LRR-repeat protein [Carex littledalei]
MDGRDLAIDRISDMPDPLLTQILSLLTTEEAFRTCILSKRWTDLWTSTDTLDFDFGSCNFGYERRNRFLRFIQGVLNRRGFSPLDKFKLRWKSHLNRSDCGIVEECISHAVACMPRLIYIYIGTKPIIKLPDSLLNCGSVKEMSLLAGYSLFESQPKSINLPSLKKLEIGHTYINDDLIEMFLLGCPVLEELALTCCPLMFEEINSNVLKKLTIERGCLETTSFTLKNASSLVTADLDISISYYTYYEDELNLLGGLPNVTSLRLNASRNVLRLLNKDIPNCLILNNLKSLELGVLETRYDWDLVVCFLQHSPNLKKLVLNFGHRVTSLGKKHYREKNSFPHEFLEIMEIRVLETRVKKEIEETVVEIMGALVKTIGKTVTL